MEKSILAVQNFKTMNCNQAVFAAFGPDYGVSEELCVRLGLGFGGGMGRQGRTCGVVTSAYLVIGLWAATQSDNLNTQKIIAADKVVEYNKIFQEMNTYLDCKDLLGYRLYIPEEKAKSEELGLHEKVCSELVKISATILEKILV
jgi:C_GCAxxG_C_C family probable redox protein